MLKNRQSMSRLAAGLLLAWLAAAGPAQVQAQGQAQEAATTAAPAAAPALEPGLWQIQSRPDIRGGQMMALPRSQRVCLRAQDIETGRIPLLLMPACQVQPGGRWEGTQLTLKISCNGLPEQAQYSGSLQAQGKSVQGQIEVILAPAQEGVERGHFIYHQMGQWVGPCP